MAARKRLAGRRYRHLQLDDAPCYPAWKPPEPLPPVTGEAPLTILYLVHCFYPERVGGTERFTLMQALQQQKAGNRVRVLSLYTGVLQGAKPFSGELSFRDEVYMGVPVTKLAYCRAPKGLFYSRIAERDAQMESFFAFLLERERPDVVHATYPQPFAAALRLCSERGLPYVVTLTDYTLACSASTMIDKSGRQCSGCQEGRRCKGCGPSLGVSSFPERFFASKGLLEQASFVTAPSVYTSNVMASQFPKISIRVIPHGLSEEFHIPAPRRQTIRRILYAGNSSPLKGFSTLLKAFHTIDDPEITLAVCGAFNGGLLRKRYSAGGKVTFLGALPPTEMRKQYLLSDCVVVPSLWAETYNFVLREALSCGCFVVASRIGALPEAIVEGKNGYLFRPGDVDSLAEALRKAAEFDCRQYLPCDFPTVIDEANEYERIYRICSR